MNQGNSEEVLHQPDGFAALPESLLGRVELSRLAIAGQGASRLSKRADLGQYFTPESIARFMASLVQPQDTCDTLRLLDAGCGNGMLTAAFIAEVLTHWTVRPRRIVAVLWEVDEELIAEIERTVALCTDACKSEGLEFMAEIHRGDFIQDASRVVEPGGLFATQILPFDVAILNPPYRKLRSNSEHRTALSGAGIETSNLYSAFVWLAMEMLGNGGQVVAITPRSFMNGAYFRPFRRALLDKLRFDRVHVYDSRKTAFKGDDVLQENVIFHAVKGAEPAPITITTSSGPSDEGDLSISITPDQFVHKDDPDSVMHVVPDETEARISNFMRRLPATLDDLAIGVSTGRIVEFRSRDRLRIHPSSTDAPLIFPRHFLNGFVEWPRATGSKPEAVTPRSADDADLMPSGWYVAVKRFSAKEERRRVVAAVYDPERIGRSSVAFDNKLNILHRNGHGLPPKLARGLAVFLNSTLVDAFFRQFSGHTQVNARDLKSLRFPDTATLERLGRSATNEMPTEAEINRLIREELLTMGKQGDDPVMAKKKIEATIEILKSLGAPREQLNERSALTLLALLDLGPSSPWKKSKSPSLGVTEIMEWMAAKFGKSYAPNSRETIRRYTLHQFIHLGLVVLNPDNPTRTTNSPNNVYQIEPDVLSLIRQFKSDSWAEELAEYGKSSGAKNQLRENARKMNLIPVTLPNGEKIELTAGGQNVLIKEIIEEFAPRFTPGGHVVYVGDAGEKHLVHETGELKRLGVVVDRHGKMPDVVIHYRKKKWLVLVEAVTSHGPITKLRHNQLKELFRGSTVGLVYVSAFLDRRAMRKHLPDIAWETDVWAAETPTHLIHFNGERFLGPYT